MVTAAALLVLGQSNLFGKFHSRQEFEGAISIIHGASFKEKWSKERVKKYLGAPDDVRKESDERYETWCYGTDGHGTLPTLGSIAFNGDKASSFTYSPYSPPPSVISENELRAALRKIDWPDPRSSLKDGVSHNVNDPLAIIRAANTLIPLGVEKAVAVLSEYSRIDPIWWMRPEYPYWVGRTAFRGKKPGYVFPYPRIGIILPSGPAEASKWPTYPILTLSGFPLPISWGNPGAGTPARFDKYARLFSKDWDVVDSKLIPPADPFPLYDEAWIKTIQPMGVDPDRFETFRSLIAGAIIRSVRNVIHVESEEWQDYNDIDEKGFEAIHQRFLKVNAHWDARLGHYVRGDGTWDPDKR